MTTLLIPPRYAHQDATLSFMQTHDRVFDMSDAGCVDAETSFLTSTGWKRIDTYETGDLVAQYDRHTGRTTFVEPIAYHKYPCNKFYHVTSSRLDMMLSSEHNVLVSMPYRNPPVTELVPMHRLYSEFAAVKHDDPKINFKKQVPIYSVLTSPEKTHKYTQPQLAIQLLAALFGQHPRAAYRLKYWYFSPKNQRQQELIESLITREYYKHSDCVRGAILPIPTDDNKPIYAIDSTGVEFGALPPHFYALSRGEYTYLQRLLLQLVGNSADASVTSERFTDVPRHLVPWMLYLGLVRGYASYANDTTVFFSDRDTSFITAIRPVDTDPSTTYKYCFTVPDGCLLLMRNGKPFLTGNSGKTRGQIDAIAYRPDIRKTLVLAPKSILTPAWKDDFKKFSPDTRVVVATAKNRETAFNQDADVYVTNLDAVTWLAAQPKALLEPFDNIIIDESDAFRHPTSLRSKAACKVVNAAKYRSLLSATPSDNGVIDLWHQMFLLDDGATLGNSYFRFRQQMYDRVYSYAAFDKWVQKPFAQDIVAELMKDVVIRHKLEECIDIPPVTHRVVYYDLPKPSRTAYEQVKKIGMTMLESGALIEAVNAVSVMTKLRQLASGAIYTVNDGLCTEIAKVDEGRYELIVDLAHEVPSCVIFFEWSHQRQGIIELLQKKGIAYGVIDGQVSTERRDAYVAQFQRGELPILLLHPASGAHGLTLTHANREIIASPTPRGSLYTQMVGRIYRAGQTRRSEIITVVARDTIDERIFQIQQDKLVGQQDMLSILFDYYKGGL